MFYRDDGNQQLFYILEFWVIHYSMKIMLKRKVILFRYGGCYYYGLVSIVFFGFLLRIIQDTSGSVAKKILILLTKPLNWGILSGKCLSNVCQMSVKYL